MQRFSLIGRVCYGRCDAWCFSTDIYILLHILKYLNSQKVYGYVLYFAGVTFCTFEAL